MIRKHPLVAVDAIIEFEGGIVLVKRKNPPFHCLFFLDFL
jgi:ADP-ribose pyrophosphatase YjhB (NUDIX family)